jgi:DME family drug/metabolite transporter
MATTISLLERLAAPLAVVLVGERLPPSGWAGVGLIVACLGLITVPAGKFVSGSGNGENFEIAKERIMKDKRHLTHFRLRYACRYHHQG